MVPSFEGGAIMGLFNLFKKKSKDNNMEPIDGIPPSTWLPTPPPVYDYDRTRTKSNTYTAPQKKQQSSPPDRLTPEGELPFGWIYAHRDFTQKLQSEYSYFLQAWLDSRKLSELKQYAALKSFVIYMNDVKVLCRNKGECYNYWRDDLFTDDYLAKRTEELNRLEAKLKSK